MFTKIISFGLIFTLLSFVVVKPTFSQTKEEKKREKKIAKIKKGIEKLGTGEDAKIKIKLYDKTKVKGYVKNTGEDNLTIIEKKNGQEKIINYSDIKSVKGKNMSLGVKIAIVAGAIIVGMLVALTIIQWGEA